MMCARTFADHGVPVTVFEKSRGVGGRMATRWSEDGLTFDHGAVFTARDERFKRYVQSWQYDGLVDFLGCEELDQAQKIECPGLLASPRIWRLVT